MLFCRRFSIIALTTPWLATMSATLATTSFAVLSSEVGEGKKKRADDDLSRSEVADEEPLSWLETWASCGATRSFLTLFADLPVVVMIDLVVT